MAVSLQGFALIELMTVVAIIGILASIAMPAYQDYSARAKVSEAILFLSSCRDSITEAVQVSPNLPSGGEWASERPASGVVSRYFASIETSDEGAVRAVIQNVNAAAQGQRLIMRPWPDLTRSGAVQPGGIIAQWDCGPDPNNTVDISRYIPATCRASAAEIGVTTNWSSGS